MSFVTHVFDATLLLQSNLQIINMHNCIMWGSKSIFDFFFKFEADTDTGICMS